MFRANAVYEGIYLLGTSIARPLISKHLVEIARETGADADRPWRHRQGQRPGPLRAVGLCAQPRHQGHRAVARLVVQVAHRPDRTSPSSTRSRCRRTSRARRRSRSTPTFCTPPPKARCWKTRGASRRNSSTSAPFRRWMRPTWSPRSTIDFKKGDPVALNGKKLSPATLLAALNDLGRDNGIGRLDLVENRFVGMKIARRLRDAGRHHPARGAPRHRIDHARPGCGAPQGRDHAALCRADLQRLLVRAGARDAAGADRQEPGRRRGHGAAEALQGQCHRHRPQVAEVALFATRWSPSRTTAAPTTRRTPKASSASTRLRLRTLAARKRNELTVETGCRANEKGRPCAGLFSYLSVSAIRSVAVDRMADDGDGLLVDAGASSSRRSRPCWPAAARRRLASHGPEEVGGGGQRGVACRAGCCCRRHISGHCRAGTGCGRSRHARRRPSWRSARRVSTSFSAAMACG